MQEKQFEENLDIVEKKMAYIKELDQAKLEFFKKNDEIELSSREKWVDIDSQHWNDINQAYKNLITSAQRAFGANLTINKVIVGIGIALLFNAVVYSWINSTDFFSAITGGAGAIFLALFFVLPQKRINKAVGNLAQIQMIFKTHAAQWEFLKLYGLEKLGSGRGNTDFKPMDIEDAKKILSLYDDLGKMTGGSIKMIQDYIETEKNTDISEIPKKGVTSKAPV